MVAMCLVDNFAGQLYRKGFEYDINPESLCAVHFKFYTKPPSGPLGTSWDKDKMQFVYPKMTAKEPEEKKVDTTPSVEAEVERERKINQALKTGIIK
jgi:hypothetical protein